MKSLLSGTWESHHLIDLKNHKATISFKRQWQNIIQKVLFNGAQIGTKQLAERS